MRMQPNKEHIIRKNIANIYESNEKYLTAMDGRRSRESERAVASKYNQIFCMHYVARSVW